MKVFEIIPVLYDGGAERFIVDLSNQLALIDGFEVVLVSLYKTDASHFLVQEISPKVRLIELGKKPGFDARMIAKLFRLIRKEKPDVVHTHLRAIEYLLPTMLLLNSRFYHTIHNDAFRECPNKYSRKIRNYYYKSGKCVPITISGESSESYVKAYRNTNNVQIINGRPIVPKSVDFEKVASEFKQYRKTVNTKVFVNIARVTKQKNQLMLTRVFSRLIQDGADVVLIIIGRVEDQDIFTEVEKLISNRIIFLHSKPNPVDYLYASDAFCLSSIYEGMPITIIEAFQTGCIPVCTPVGGVVNMIQPGINGLLSESVKEADFLKCVSEFLQLDESEKIKLSKKSKDTFNSLYRMETTAQKYAGLFATQN